MFKGLGGTKSVFAGIGVYIGLDFVYMMFVLPLRIDQFLHS